MASKGERDVDLAPSTAPSTWRDNGSRKTLASLDMVAATPRRPRTPRIGRMMVRAAGCPASTHLEDEPWDDVCC